MGQFNKMNDKNIIRARSKNGFFEKNNFLKNYYANFGAVESCAENSGTFVRSTLRERGKYTVGI